MNRYRLQAVVLACLLLACYSYIMPRWADWSQNSRLDMILAIADDGTLWIDRYADNTGDYAIFRGHKYSDKAPGTALMALPVYLSLRPLIDQPLVQQRLEAVGGGAAMAESLNPEGTGVNSSKVRFAVVQYLLSVLVVSVPSALFGSLFYIALLRLELGQQTAILGAVAYTLGTPAAVYAGNLYSHQLVALMLFGAFWLGWDPPATNNRRVARGLLAGLLLGWAVISEYPALLPATLIGLYIVYRYGWRWALLLVAGAIPPLALFATHNVVGFGTPWLISYSYSAHWGGQFSTGLMSMTYPQPLALWGLTFGSYRGLFIRSPWLLLALPGYLLWWRSGRRRAEWLVSLLVPLSLVLPYSATATLWWGGNAAGPRYLVAMLPFLALGAAWGLQALLRLPVMRPFAFLVILLSLAAVWLEALAGQSFPPEAIRATWIGYVVPAWATGDIARNLGMAFGLGGWSSLIPLAVIVAILLGVLTIGGAHPPTDVRRKRVAALEREGGALPSNPSGQAP